MFVTVDIGDLWLHPFYICSHSIYTGGGGVGRWCLLLLCQRLFDGLCACWRHSVASGVVSTRRCLLVNARIHFRDGRSGGRRSVSVRRAAGLSLIDEPLTNQCACLTVQLLQTFYFGMSRMNSLFWTGVVCLLLQNATRTVDLMPKFCYFDVIKQLV